MLQCNLLIYSPLMPFCNSPYMATNHNYHQDPLDEAEGLPRKLARQRYDYICEPNSMEITVRMVSWCVWDSRPQAPLPSCKRMIPNLGLRRSTKTSASPRLPCGS